MTKEVKYRREMNRNFMIIEPDTPENGCYTIKMMTENKIPGLLPFKEKNVDGRREYYFDITSRQPLKRILELTDLSSRQILMLVGGVLHSLRKMELYFLDENQLLMEPEFIYIEPDSFEPALCLLPGRYKEFGASFQELAQYLLDHVNAKDRDAVVLAFGIFQASRIENFGIEDIEKSLSLPVESGKKGRKGINAAIPEEAGSRPGEAKDDKFGQSRETDDTWRDTREGRVKNRDSGDSGKAALKEYRYQILALGLMVAIPFAVYGLFGLSGVLRYRWILAGAESVIGIVILGSFFLRREAEFDTEENQGETWNVLFREDEEFVGDEEYAGGEPWAEGRRRENRGGESRGGESRGRENRGGESRGRESRGGENWGGESRGGESRGGENWYGESRGRESRGRESRGGESRDGENREENIRKRGDLWGEALGRKSPMGERQQKELQRGEEQSGVSGDRNLTVYTRPGLDSGVEAEPDDSLQTVLLTAKPEEKAERKLVSQMGEETIIIPYFPFLIGKNKQMVDMCINHPSVSRLHLRIDEMTGEYRATDLNSTNGTIIAGHLLTSNEAYPLKPGDQVEIAGHQYIFM